MVKKNTKNNTKNNTKRDKITKEFEELKTTMQRVQADFDNYRKRTEREVAQSRDNAQAELIKEILPAIDNLDTAIKKADNKDAFYEGCVIIHKQLQSILEKFGLKEISTKGRFNPEIHEVVAVEENKDKKGEIIEEIQKGYTFKGSIIRPSKVRVAK